MADNDLAHGDLATIYKEQVSRLSSITSDFSSLVGARIISAGIHKGCRKGGFAIDFQHEGQPVQRLVLGYTELGEWIEYLGPRADGEKE